MFTKPDSTTRHEDSTNLDAGPYVSPDRGPDSHNLPAIPAPPQTGYSVGLASSRKNDIRAPKWPWLIGGMVAGIAIGIVFTFSSLFALGNIYRAQSLDYEYATPVPSGVYFKGRLTFSSNRDGHYEIYVADIVDASFDDYYADASKISLTRLTNDHANDLYPSWSPDGRRIAFSSDKAGAKDIYVINADGSGLTRLTRDSSWNEHPMWSPDGKRIAFRSDRSGNWDIYVMNTDGSRQARLTTSASEEDNPAWSPDGKSIAFDSSTPGNTEIYAMRADGTKQERLTYNKAEDWRPAWSPDGHYIAFTSDRDELTRIWVMNSDGTKEIALSDGESDDEDPTWSSDGKFIIYSSKEKSKQEPWSVMYAVRIEWSDGTSCDCSGTPLPEGLVITNTLQIFSGSFIDRDPSLVP